MSSDSESAVAWPELPLQDFVYFQEGPGLRNWQYRDQGIPFVNIRCIKDGRLLRDEMTCLDPAEVAEKYEHFLLNAGDYVVSSSGTLGRLAEVVKSDLPCMLNTSVIRFRPRDVNVLDRRYLKYFLLSDPFNEQILAHANGSAQLNYGPSHLKQMSIAVPPISDQINIGKLLGCIDDRITLLRETNATLESIAQAMFKSWFVDFDPVHANAKGRDSPPGGRRGLYGPDGPTTALPEGMSESIPTRGTPVGTPGVPPDPSAAAALFPDSFEESELGLVPRWWKIGKVGDFAKQHKGSINPLKNPGTLYEHFSLPAFDSQHMPVLELGTEIKSNKTSVPPDAVLLSKLNPHIPRIWLPVDVGSNAVCSTEFLVFVPAGGASKEFIYCAFTTPKFKELLCQLVTGTSNSHQRVKPDGVSSMSAVLPPMEVLEVFADVVKPMFERIGHNLGKAQTLAALRDTLLPRLISGQLRLPEAEVALKEAAA